MTPALNGALALACLAPPASADASAADQALHELADRPWWAPRVPLHEPLPGTSGSKAADCGECHTEIYEEWQASIHAHAWTDAQFQRELHKDPEVGWICINCHTPAAGQQEELVDWAPDQGVREVDRRPNPDFDPSWQEEGITCLSCHWRDQGIAAPHDDVEAPHPTVYAPELLEADLCLSCHQAAVAIEDALVCYFDTGREWEEELAASLGLPSGQRPPPCQSCHMESVERPTAQGGRVRATRRHAWPGSLIPKDDAPAGERAKWEGWLPGLTARVELPDHAAAGDRVEAVVVLENLRAGHRVPTGDPERYLRLRVQVQGAQQDVIAGLQARIGQRWLWWPVATRLDDDRIRPGEARRYAVPFVLPQGGATVRATLEHFRISPENASYHGLDGYPTHRLVHELEATLLPSVATRGLPR